MDLTEDILTNETAGPMSDVVWNVTSEPKMDFWENRVSAFLFSVPTVILFTLGTIGNTLSFAVFSGPNMRHSVTSVYFRILAITDTIVLLIGCPIFFIHGTFDLDIRLLSRSSCKIWISALQAMCYQSCWVLVFIAVDRFIGVWMPHKYRTFCSRKLAVINSVVVFFLVTFSVFVFLAVARDLNEDGTKCTITDHYKIFYETVFHWLNLTVLNVIPALTLVTLNICIIAKISRAAVDRRTSMHGQDKKSSQALKQSNNATFILLSISLVYIICTIPPATIFLVVPLFGDSPHGRARGTLFFRACEILHLTNHAINFVLYCVHGTVFRKELKRLFCRPAAPSRTGSMATNITVTSSVRQEKYTKCDDV